LKARFPTSSIIDAFGFVYPKYWQAPNVEENFEKHLVVIKEHYCHKKKIDISKEGDDALEVEKSLDSLHNELDFDNAALDGTMPKARVTEPILSSSLLDEQKVMFKITMKENSKLALTGELPLNPVTQLWRRLDASGFLRHKLLEYIKVTELAVVTILGSIEMRGPLVLSVL